MSKIGDSSQNPLNRDRGIKNEWRRPSANWIDQLNKESLMDEPWRTKLFRFPRYVPEPGQFIGVVCLIPYLMANVTHQREIDIALINTWLYVIRIDSAYSKQIGSDLENPQQRFVAGFRKA